MGKVNNSLVRIWLSGDTSNIVLSFTPSIDEEEEVNGEEVNGEEVKGEEVKGDVEEVKGDVEEVNGEEVKGDVEEVSNPEISDLIAKNSIRV